MKKLFMMFLCLTSLNLWAQSTSQDNISGETGRPASADFFTALVTRIHSLQIDQKVMDMQKEGLKEKKFFLGITASGAMLYDHEIAGRGFFNDDSLAGRNAGLQVIPYTVSITDDHRIFISTSAVGFKNMNSEVQDDDLDLCYNQDESAWRVIDNLEILKFEYNKNMNISNLEDFHMRVVQLDVKFNALPNLPENQFLAVKAGVSPVGYHKTTATLMTNDKKTLEGFEASIRYGLEYNITTKNGLRLNAEVMASQSWSLDHDGNFDESRRAEFDQKVEELRALGMTQGDFEWSVNKLIDDEYRVDEKRVTFYVAPKVEISKKVSKDGKSPKRLGMSFSMNIPMQDQIKSGINRVDLSGNNSRLFNAGIFFNF